VIIKSYKDNDFEIVAMQSENNLYGVTLLKNDKQAEFQGNIPNLEDALEIYDYYLDRMNNNDLSGWQGSIE
jgi:hypothetical protein